MLSFNTCGAIVSGWVADHHQKLRRSAQHDEWAFSGNERETDATKGRNRWLEVTAQCGQGIHF